LDMNYHYPYLVVAVFLIVSYVMAFTLRHPSQMAAPK